MMDATLSAGKTRPLGSFESPPYDSVPYHGSLEFVEGLRDFAEHCVAGDAHAIFIFHLDRPMVDPHFIGRERQRLPDPSQMLLKPLDERYRILPPISVVVVKVVVIHVIGVVRVL